MDSIRDFKDKWYVVRPTSQTVVDVVFDPAPVVDEDGEPCYDTNGE